MLEKPLAGSAAAPFATGFLKKGQTDAMGVRSFDAEMGRLSLHLGDGRTVEIQPAPHPRADDRFAIRVRSHGGHTEHHGFFQMENDLSGVSGPRDVTPNGSVPFPAENSTEHLQPPLPQFFEADSTPAVMGERAAQRPGDAVAREAQTKLPAPQTGEEDRRFSPLRAAFTPEEAAQFEWIAETDTIQTYEHQGTFRYLHIDGDPERFGQFYDQTRTPISREAALKHALPPGPQVHAVAPQVEVAPGLEAAAQAPALDPTGEAGREPGFDTFTRRLAERGERESWRERIAELSRNWRLSRKERLED